VGQSQYDRQSAFRRHRHPQLLPFPRAAGSNFSPPNRTPIKGQRAYYLEARSKYLTPDFEVIPFDQTGPSEQPRLPNRETVKRQRPCSREHQIEQRSDQYWQYANEAMRRALESKTELEERALLNLARTWTLAALKSDGVTLAT
jgi:hypothetical protein